MMKKSDLKNGMVVQTRNNTIWMVFNNTLQYKHGWENLNDYDENLMSCGEGISVRMSKEYDIIRVGKYVGSNIFNLELNDSNIEWVWERYEYKIRQIEYDFLTYIKQKAEKFKVFFNLEGSLAVKFYDKDDVGVFYMVSEFIKFRTLKNNIIYNIDDILQGCLIREE